MGRVMGAHFSSLLLLVFLSLVIQACSSKPSGDATSAVRGWPPQLGMPYPDLLFTDQDGEAGRLSQFEGEILLIQLVDMRDPLSQAFSGARMRGGYESIPPIAGAPSVAEFVKRYARGAQLSDVVYLQLLLDNGGAHPTPDDAYLWAKHFRFSRNERQYVVVTDDRLALGPGLPKFHLVDREFILRVEASAAQPENDFHLALLPRLPQLIAQPNWLGRVNAAYATELPRTREKFDLYRSTLPEEESRALHAFFRLTDRAVAAKAECLNRLRGDDAAKAAVLPYEEYHKTIEPVVRELEQLAIPAGLSKVRGFVLLALIEQGRYLRESARRVQLGEGFTGVAPLENGAISSHQNLRKALQLLQEAFPDRRNQQAMIDHIQALDLLPQLS